MNEINTLSMSTTPIQVVTTASGIDTNISTATGFFFTKNENETFLFTNWHVVTGRNPHDFKLLNKHGAVPHKLRCFMHENIGQENAINTSRINFFEIIINSEDGNNPIWFEHHTHKHKVDVVCIKIKTIELNSFSYHLVSDYPHFHPNYQAKVMDDAFIIGYPWGLTGGNQVLPIFKSGSIASEPVVDISGLPYLLIDSRTTSGMSGSPVIARHRGILQVEGKQQSFGSFDMFLGIYSGRLLAKDDQDKELEIPEIGIVWKSFLLNEIITNGIKGTKLKDML